MILKRLFQSTKRRRNADAAADPSQTQADPGARRLACKQSTDLELLQRCAREDTDAGVRDYASARLRKLMSGADPACPPLAERMDRLREAADKGPLSAYLAAHAEEPELRRLAISLTSDPQVLAERAAGDSIAALRLAAVERIEDKACLERVAQQIGKKDKKVLRTARDKLKSIAEAEAAPQRLRTEAEELCAKAQRLGRSGVWSQEKAMADHLRSQWQALGTENLPEELGARFSLAMGAFEQGFAAHQAEQELQRAQSAEHDRRQAECQALLKALSELELDEDTETRLDDFAARWEQASGPQSGLHQDYTRLTEGLSKSIEQRRELLKRHHRLQAHIDKGESLVQRSTPLKLQDLRRWREQGEKLAAMNAEDALAHNFTDLAARIDRRMEKQRTHAQQKLEQLPERLRLLKEELDEGVLRKATGLHQSLHADLDLISLSGLPHKEYAAAEQEYRRLTPRLRELQQWRKWGTDQHRQAMCDAMAKLLEAELPLEEIHDTLQSLQAEWKQLDHSGSPVNENLWKRFHNLADQVYERCNPYLEDQAKQREANRLEREALCLKLEEFLEQADWSRMDWKRAVRAEREIRTAWTSIGPVAPKLRKPLDRRYHKAMKQLDAQLAEERARNKALKTELIAQAGRLAEEPDLDGALREVRQLQRQWTTTVACRRKQENQMWRSFRDACDRIYQRRDAANSAQREQQEANASLLEECCKEIENLGATIPPKDARDLDGHLRELRQRWEQHTGLELDRQIRGRLEKRWNAGVAEIQRRIGEARLRAEQEQVQRMRALDALCRELEAAVEAAPLSDPDRQHWRARFGDLPMPDTADWREDIMLRFETALDASTDGPSRQTWLELLTSNLTQRERLCLRLEIAAGVDSPPEAEAERLAYQVSRLSGHLREGEQGSDDLQALIRDWYLEGPVPAAAAASLQARFEHAVSASTSGADGENPARRAAEG